MSDPAWARALFGASLGFHIVFATLGVGLPLMIALAEIRGYRTSDPRDRLMARRWAALFAVILGAGVVSGTIVAVQLSLLWPSFMRLVGQIIALPFAIEVFAFFIEAVFTAIYIFAGDRIDPRLRIFSALAVSAGAGASALLITDVNAFMNTPTGFRLAGGQLVDIQPWKAMLNPSMPTELSHVLVTAYFAVAFYVAAMAAWRLRAPLAPAQREYHLRELSLSMSVAGVMVILTGITGDWSGKFLAAVQPVKFAAAEGLFHTSRYAPLTIGGFVDTNTHTVRGGIELPGLLSWLATGRFNGQVLGLEAFPRTEWPPLFIHLLFDLMVAVGGFSLLVAALYWGLKAHRRPQLPRWLLFSIVAMGPLSFIGIEVGWVFAELGRQPWTVVGLLKTSDAATSTPDVKLFFFVFIGLYIVLSLGAVVAVRKFFASHPLQSDLDRVEGIPHAG